MKALIVLLISLPILLVGITIYFLANQESISLTSDLIEESGIDGKDTLRNRLNETSKNHSNPGLALEKKVNDWNASSLVFSKELNDENLKKISPESPDNKTVQDNKFADKKESKRSKRAKDNRTYINTFKSETKYYHDGKKEMESISKSGRLFSAKVWKPNGELCPVTNLSDGNGVIVRYNSWGTQWYRLSYRNGLPIWGAQSLRSGDYSSTEKNVAKIEKTRSPKDLLRNKKMVNLTKLLLSKGSEIELIWCEPGSFMMGSPASEEGRGKDETLHKVTLTRGFFLGKKEVTQEQWQEIMNKNPSHYKGKNLPVDSISYQQANLFCIKLNEREKKAKRLPKGMIYQLPSEAQWEYACRAGSQTMYSFGNSLTKNQGNIKKGEGGQIAAGSTVPNRWGFHEIHGNLWEWCADKYKPFDSEPAIDPVCTDISSRYYVQRSGTWLGETHLRSALRHHNLPTYEGKTNGMRVCLALTADLNEDIDFENQENFQQ